MEWERWLPTQDGLSLRHESRVRRCRDIAAWDLMEGRRRWVLRQIVEPTFLAECVVPVFRIDLLVTFWSLSLPLS